MLNDNQDRVDAYLRNEMSDLERKAFERDLQQNESLREDYELSKAISKALADRQAKIEQMRQWELKAQMMDQIDHRNVAKRKTFRNWVITFSAAACLFAGFFAIKSIFVTFSPNDVVSMPSFGEADRYRGNINIAPIDSLIRKGSYKEALSMTDSLSGVCVSVIESIGHGTELTDKDNYKMLEQKHVLYVLEWRRINLLIALDREKDAFEILKTFKDEEGSYKKDANMLYDKLNEKQNE